ncbi:MAG: hypothetical protein KBS83_01640 [Lachnospiraceae bacterium]|nr:hypothetical protein [Candidatus Equihabitans merdae]
MTVKERRKGKHMAGTCDNCVFCAYDEDEEDYICQADMDEDDYYRFLTDKHEGCPFFRLDDEYAVVRHQM